MNDLKLVTKNGQALVDSREVAKMTDKRHANLVRDIEGYIQILENSTLSSQDFFIESSYKVDGNHKTYKCFLLTKIGCDMVANKMIGTKGVLFTATYTKKFEQMEHELQQGYKLPSNYKEALLHLVAKEEENEKLQQEVEELKPKAMYHDLVLQNKNLMGINKIAKDYGMSGTTLNRILHEEGVQYKQGGTWLLYSKYQDKGYTGTKTFAYEADKSSVYTQWTQKGRMFIYEFLKTRKGIVPLIERDDQIRLIN